MQLPKCQYIAIATTVASTFTAIIASTSSHAFNQGMQEGANAAKGIEHITDLFGATGVFNTITNVLLFVIGAISVIMIIIGGLRYVLSNGDSSNVTAAKNTVLYAIVGLIVALLAYAIINFVLTSFTAGGGGGGTNV